MAMCGRGQKSAPSVLCEFDVGTVKNWCRQAGAVIDKQSETPAFAVKPFASYDVLTDRWSPRGFPPARGWPLAGGIVSNGIKGMP